MFEEEKDFDDIDLALKGETVIQVPRVSRETIISILQTHTNLIRSMKRDHAKLANKVGEVEKTAIQNSENIINLTDSLEETNKKVTELFKLSDEFRKEMDELSEKVAELYLLKKQMMEQKEFIENLSMRYNKFNEEVHEFMTETGKTIVDVDQSCKDTVFQLTELKHYVDHFADNLVLTSGQIIIDPDAGFNSKAINLTETLKMCSNTLNDIQNESGGLGGKIDEIFLALDGKAPDSVLFNVNTLERKVSTIEVHLRKEEEQGLGALRKTCDELSLSVQSMSLEMNEKIDRESVGFIVHEKYEEIVRYLQDALQSSLEDETRFKQKADEIQEMVLLLTNSKADRTEIQAMQELMVKSEALLKKVGGNLNIKERLKDLVSRKELETILELKVDKIELDQQLSLVLANTKKSRRLTSRDTANAPVEDLMNTIQYSNSTNNINNNMNNSTLNRRTVVGSSQLSNIEQDVMNNTYNNVGMNYKNSTNNTNNNNNNNNNTGLMVGAYPKNSLDQLHEQRILSGSAPPPHIMLSNNNSTYNHDKEDALQMQGGAALSSINNHNNTNNYSNTNNYNNTNIYNNGVIREEINDALSIDNDDNSNKLYSTGGKKHLNQGIKPPVVAIGKSITPSININNNNSPGKSRNNEDFPTFVKNKSKNPVTSMSLPTTIAPGSFRMASESGKPGYNNSNINNNNNSNNNSNNSQVLYNNQQPLNVQSDVTDHISYLNGPVVGGGFNTHSKQLKHALPVANTIAKDDVEGKGLMLKGDDGHFYYQDNNQ